MFNLVEINLPDANKNYKSKCRVPKCGNDGRYQIYSNIEEAGLPDWEGEPICSRHLVEEARYRPEIIVSLIDILIDTMEKHDLFPENPAPGSSMRRHVVPIRK